MKLINIIKIIKYNNLKITSQQRFLGGIFFRENSSIKNNRFNTIRAWK